MSEPLIRRRSLPGSLRWLAQKLNEPLTDAERAGVALVLTSLADELDPPNEPVRRIDGTIDPHGHLRETIVQAIHDRLDASVPHSPGAEPPQPWMNEPEYNGEVSIRELADAILSAVLTGPVRPDEEPTP